jgi:hypothetical protein
MAGGNKPLAVLRQAWKLDTEGPGDGDEKWEEVGE